MRWSTLLPLVAAVALYAPTFGHFFVSDDFLNLERNAFRTVGEGLTLFSTRDVDFYRPIPRLHFGILDGLFGDRVTAWHLASTVLHGLTAVAAGLLAGSLLGPGRRRAATWTGVFFAVHFVHVEPVVWASGVTSIYVTLFLLLSLHFFRRARETGRGASLSVLAFAAALLSKETAVAFVPLLLVTTAIWPPGPAKRAKPWPGAGEALPYLLLLVAYGVTYSGIESGAGDTPYRFAPGMHVVKNLGFFFAGCFLPLRYWALRDAWAASVGDGGVAAFLGGIFPFPGLLLVAGAAGLVLVAARGSRDARGALAWILVAAAPFVLLPGSGERFLYLASFGACLLTGLAADRALSWHGPARAWAGRAAVAGLLVLHVAGARDRQADWETASDWTREIRGRWSYLRSLDADEPIEFVGVPESWRSAWVFRNGFDSMVRIYWEGRPYTLDRGELGPEGPGAPPRRLGVVPNPNGTIGVVPEHLLPERRAVPPPRQGRP